MDVLRRLSRSSFLSFLSHTHSLQIYPVYNNYAVLNHFTFGSRRLPSCAVSAGSNRCSTWSPVILLQNSSHLGFLLSLSARNRVDSSISSFLSGKVAHADSGKFFEWHKTSESCLGGKANAMNSDGSLATVVLLGWLGAKRRHLKKYAEWYTSRGISALTFIVNARDVLWFDFGRRVERQICALSDELVSLLSETEKDGRGRTLVFHTFSNTGWLVYGAVLHNLQGREGFSEQIKGCIFDSGADPELNPQVWAAGFSAALLQSRTSSNSTNPSEDGSERMHQNTSPISSNLRNNPSPIETLLLSWLDKLFSFVLKLPHINKRLMDIIALLEKDQPPCPQLYLYSSADRVIPYQSIESFIEKQKRAGRRVLSFNFRTSPHVDHYRTFTSVYSSLLHDFLRMCLTS